MRELQNGGEPQWLPFGRPGSAPQLEYSQPMRRLRDQGHEAVPTLIANLDHEKTRYQCIQILGDLRAKQAVPKLLSMLKLEDDLHDQIIIGALGRITEHPEAYKFYRFYFDEGVRREAHRKFSLWWKEQRAVSQK